MSEKHLQPIWENGSLYYPRNDLAMDEEGHQTHIDPFSGNSAIGYARFNVENGQKIMMHAPWTKETMVNRPYVDELDLSHGVDCLRNVWDQDRNALILTVCKWAGKGSKIAFDINHLSSGCWKVCTSQGGCTTHRLLNGGQVAVDVTLQGDEEVDIVVIQDI